MTATNIVYLSDLPPTTTTEEIRGVLELLNSTWQVLSITEVFPDTPGRFFIEFTNASDRAACIAAFTALNQHAQIVYAGGQPRPQPLSPPPPLSPHPSATIPPAAINRSHTAASSTNHSSPTKPVNFSYSHHPPSTQSGPGAWTLFAQSKAQKASTAKGDVTAVADRGVGRGSRVQVSKERQAVQTKYGRLIMDLLAESRGWGRGGGPEAGFHAAGGRQSPAAMVRSSTPLRSSTLLRDRAENRAGSASPAITQALSAPADAFGSARIAGSGPADGIDGSARVVGQSPAGAVASGSAGSALVSHVIDTSGRTMPCEPASSPAPRTVTDPLPSSTLSTLTFFFTPTPSHHLTSPRPTPSPLTPSLTRPRGVVLFNLPPSLSTAYLHELVEGYGAVSTLRRWEPNSAFVKYEEYDGACECIAKIEEDWGVRAEWSVGGRRGEKEVKEGGEDREEDVVGEKKELSKVVETGQVVEVVGEEKKEVTEEETKEETKEEVKEPTQEEKRQEEERKKEEKRVKNRENKRRKKQAKRDRREQEERLEEERKALELQRKQSAPQREMEKRTEVMKWLAVLDQGLAEVARGVEGLKKAYGTQ